MTCQICGGGAGTMYRSREMMFGLGHPFSYFECDTCGCVQLADPPAEMGAYYPPNYYSYEKVAGDPPAKPTNRLRQWLYERRNEAQTFGRGGFWGLVARLRPRPDIHPLDPSIRAVPGLRLHSRVLDVGCGSGRLLTSLATRGFTDLTGVDPFLPAGTARPAPQVRLLPHAIEDHRDGPYHLIMMHHSLEHMPDQRAAVRAAHRLLAPGGTLLIRVPTASSATWREYRTEWVALDPPRHYVIHTHDSLRRLAAECGFRVDQLACDSDALGYSGSELYRRGERLFDPDTGTYTDHARVLGADRLAELAARAAADNARLDGDGLVAYLRPVRPA